MEFLGLMRRAHEIMMVVTTWVMVDVENTTVG